jgi:hypothetical protein
MISHLRPVYASERMNQWKREERESFHADFFKENSKYTSHFLELNTEKKKNSDNTDNVIRGHKLEQHYSSIITGIEIINVCIFANYPVALILAFGVPILCVLQHIMKTTD